MIKPNRRILILSVFVLMSCTTNYTSRKIKCNTERFMRKTRHVAYTAVTHVTLTCYQPVASQCDDDPFTTSDGSRINLERLKSGKVKWCAISRDLLYLFPKGKPKRIFVDGYGLYEVRDVMNRRHKHKVDLLIHPKNSIRIKIKGVKIKILL